MSPTIASEAGTHATASTTHPGAGYDLTQLSDGELLASTRGLVGRSNQLLAALLLHLGEVEARGVHRTRACSSLYAYCIYELRFSEDEAFRRVAAARLVQRFPPLVAAVATGELHLTGLLMLGPHLTAENLSEVLARAKHRTKKELARLVRELSPLPDVPPRIEPLGSAPARLVPPPSTWETFARSLCPVRALPPGDRPRDWTEGANDQAEAPFVEPSEPEAPEPTGAPESPAPARVEAAALAVPQRYKVQFTASEEYVRLVEEAEALLAHALPGAALGEIHLRAMRLLVTDLKKRKYAVTARPRSRSTHEDLERSTTQKRGRYVPAAVRRAVFERDGGGCSYVDTSGRPCRETRRLEFHHVEPFARGGAPSEQNLTLRCKAHNALAAEEDFGRELIEDRCDALAHETERESAASNGLAPPLPRRRPREPD